MTITEVRKIRWELVRQFCISNAFYTMGSSENYNHLLFDLCDKCENVTTPWLQEIATNIYDHTEAKYFPGMSPNTAIASIMFGLVRECCYTYFRE